MKILLSNVAAVLTLCLASPSYASDVTQESDAVTLSANTAHTDGKSLGDLPDEIMLHILQQLSLEELQRSSRIDQRCHRLANDKTLLNKWAEAAQKLNPLNPPAHNISDVHAHIIKSVLTNNLKFTIYGYPQGAASGIQDNGKLIMRADFDKLGIKKHQPTKVIYDGRERYTEYSSKDGKIHCGAMYDANCKIQSFIVTDVDTKTVELLKKPSNVTLSYPYAMSSDGKTIVGGVDYKEDLQYATTNGFRWTRQTGMVLLRNSKGPFINNTQCTDKNGQLIGGVSFSTSEGGIQAAFWIDDNHYVVDELPNISSNPLLNGLRLKRTLYVSHNGKALHGDGTDSTGKKDIYWSLVFGDGSIENIQQ